jgi:TM2 domain-containing membrane protein YozV
MNCANHPEAAATAYCRTCGKPLCQICHRPAQGTVFCDEHLPVAAAANPYTVPPPSPYASPYAAPVNPNAPSPGLAFILGLFIPGVGAIYNGQYAKGVIHVLILGLLISIMGSGAANGLEPLIGLFTAVFIFYMAFEAYHTAAKRQRGEPVDEFSSILPMSGSRRGFPVGPILLIALGVIFLLETLDIVRLYQIVRFWPVFLILLGCYMLYVRISGNSAMEVPPTSSEAGHER